MHETKNCPCCGESFECKSGSITICQCTEVKLSVEAREFLAKSFDDCVCKKCLQSVKHIMGTACGNVGSDK